MLLYLFIIETYGAIIGLNIPKNIIEKFKQYILNKYCIFLLIRII